ncbi:reverse transcriptase domain-containing protein [Tanacetum coccineum]|uniref:Reverse transcriptase domain-containing protein n=1 Tax=Tanacetum coccineum TaxID=301880 RepID=A0ABQ5I2S5_9ASTR
MPHTRDEERYHSENDHDQGGHWKSKKHKPSNEDDLSQPWLCEETDPFTARIRNFEVPKRTRMPVNVKTYDGMGDPYDHLKIFQAAEKIERWAMPTWCHMFNSTLIGSARVWFDKLPSESIDDYEMLRKTFLGNYSQQKKYIKDPVEIHHIKQREGEPTKAFMERFKAESMHVSGAPECMRISGFMHGITNPDLIKKLNDNILKSVDEMMSVTTAFLRGEVTAANQSKKKRQDRFTPLTKTPEEILAMETVNFKAPPPMTGLAENRNKNKFCEFHEDKGHITDECIHLRKQIEEAVNESRRTPYPSHVRGWRVSLGSVVRALLQQASPKIKKSNDSSNDPSPRIQQRNILVVGANITNGDFKRWRALNERPDELHGGQIPVTIQWHHRSPRSQKNPSGPIYRSQNAKIPSKRRNSDNPQQYHNTSGVQNGDRNTKCPSTKRTSGHRRNQSSNPPRVSRANHHDRRKLIRKRKNGTLQPTQR